MGLWRSNKSLNLDIENKNIGIINSGKYGIVVDLRLCRFYCLTYISVCVPVISIPQVNDQYMVRKQLVRLGAGLELNMKEITDEILRNSVKTVLSDTSYKASSAKIGRSFIEAGGYKAAAKFILDHIKQ